MFEHDAFLYDGITGFLEGVVPFVREGLEAGEAVLVAVDTAKIERLRAALEGGSDRLRLIDMRAFGQNPARIIPVWQEFVAESSAGGGRFRGVGEPVWPGRSGAELAECHLHESLLNLAFDDGPAWRLLCPYDTSGLDPEVVEASRRTHPFVRWRTERDASASYERDGIVPEDLAPVEPAVGPIEVLAFDQWSLREVRRSVEERGRSAGLDPVRLGELVLAVDEVATNSVLHGGGGGVLRIWQDDEALLCEVRDQGSIRDPLAGRAQPALERQDGRGLWLANQLCDLVQVRSSERGTIVRLQMALGAPSLA